MFRGRKILVTGGAGFIGSHLVERLVELGSEVTSFDHKPREGLSNLASVRNQIDTLSLDLVRDDLEMVLAAKQFEVVFHLSGSAHMPSSIVDPVRDFERNALATLRMLDAIRRITPQAKFIYTSSALVYRASSRPVAEDEPLYPASPYGVSKLAAEQYVRLFAQLYGLQAVVCRLFPVFGPRLRSHIIFDIVGRLRTDGTTLSLVGDGTQVRDYTYVTDAVDALLLIARRAPLAGEAYNVGSGNPIEISELANLVAKAMGLSPQLVYSGKGQTGDSPQLRADIARLRTLGYRPKVELKAGVERTVCWLLESGVSEPKNSLGAPAHTEETS